MASVYPTSLDTTDTLYVAANGLLYTLSSDIDSNVVTIPVNEDTQAAPATGYLSVVGGEAIHYASKTQFSFTGCTRHDDGTSASSHKHNDQLKVGLVAAHHNSLVTAVLALEAKVGSGNTGIDGAQMKAASIAKSKLVAGLGFGATFFRIHLAVSSAAVGSNFLVPLDTKDIDDGNWNAGTFKWTAPSNGVVSASIRVSSSTAAIHDTTCALQRVSDSKVLVRGNESSSPSGNFNGSHGSDFFRVANGDALQLFRDYTSVNTSVVAGYAETYLSIMFIAD